MKTFRLFTPRIIAALAFIALMIALLVSAQGGEVLHSSDMSVPVSTS